MSKHFKETMSALRRYYISDQFSVAAEMLSEDGFMANIDTPERSYYIVTRINRNAEVVIMEIAPEIHCTSKETISMASEYANRVNEIHAIGNVKIAGNGRLYIQVEQKIDTAPITVDILKSMEATALSIASVFSEPLQKVANAKLLSAIESEPQKLAEVHIHKITKELSFFEEISSRHKKRADSHSEKEISDDMISFFDDADSELNDENDEKCIIGDIFNVFSEPSKESKNNNSDFKLNKKGSLISRLRRALNDSSDDAMIVDDDGSTDFDGIINNETDDE